MVIIICILISIVLSYSILLICRLISTFAQKTRSLKKSSPQVEQPARGDAGPQEVKSSGKRYDWTPFKRIPDVRDMKITLSGIDTLMLQFNIRKRVKEAKIEYSPYSNRSLNRFFEHQLRRLEKADSRKYWTIVNSLMSRSNVFWIICCNHVFPQWHRKRSLTSILDSISKAKAIHVNPNAELTHRRVYIAKGKPGSKDYRPLGVPSLEWRLYLHGLNQFIVKRFDHLLPGWQHGFRPKRGTSTAWISILTKVLQAPFIFEFDLVKYFDRVRLQALAAKLAELGMPSELIRKLIIINGSEVDQTKANYGELDSQFIQARIELYKAKSPSAWIFPITQILDNIREVPVVPLCKWPENYGWGYVPQIHKLGLPQGAGTSPFLSMIVMAEGIGRLIKETPGLKVIAYADDGLFYTWKLRTALAIKGLLKKRALPADFFDLDTIDATYILDRKKWISNLNSWLNPSKWYITKPNRNYIITFDKKGRRWPQETLGPTMVDWTTIEQIMTHFGDRRWDTKIREMHPWREMVPHLCPWENIQISSEKSAWVKWNGKWLKPLKFLGIIYYGRLNKLAALTRRGSTLVMDKEQLIRKKALLSRTGQTEEVDDITRDTSTWEWMVKMKLWGFIQSRLYSGTWNLDDFKQEFAYRFIKGSWSDLTFDTYGPGAFRKRSKDHTLIIGKASNISIINSSSFACKSVLNIVKLQKEIKRPNKYDWTNKFLESVFKEKSSDFYYGKLSDVEKDLARTNGRWRPSYYGSEGGVPTVWGKS